jgi:hypothetical protein
MVPVFGLVCEVESMSTSLTIAIITARKNSEAVWLVDSIFREVKEAKLLVVDSSRNFEGKTIRSPKPCTWSGPHRLTSKDWWSKPNSINTAFCLCETEWCLLLDDRSILLPGWYKAVEQAMSERYIMAGAYEKRTNMTVENGIIKNVGIIVGEDDRLDYVKKRGIKTPYLCTGSWLYGCCVLMPLEAALHVNGSPEQCNGLGMEDSVLGMLLNNNHYVIKYDPRAMLIEDRTPGLIGDPIPRTSKEKHPHDKNDKAHKLLDWAKTAKRSVQPFGDLRKLRDEVQSGKPFPIMTEPTHDWYDNQPLKDL